MLFTSVFILLNFIKVQLIYNVLIFVIWQNDSVIYIYTHKYLYIYYFHIIFHYGLSQDIEYCSLCYTIRPCCSP